MIDLHSLYQDINQHHFESLLPEIEVVWNKRLRRVFGRCHFQRKGRKYIPSKIDLKWPYVSERQLRKTLVHEMCHLWAHINHSEKGHGRHFWNKMAECGYPDGHRFPDSDPEELDRYQKPTTDFIKGDVVFFDFRKNGVVRGVVSRVNRRTVSINADGRRFRVSPSLLRRQPDLN